MTSADEEFSLKPGLAGLNAKEGQQLGLLQVDYERTTKFIEGVLSTSAVVRGIAISAWLAVIGVSLERSSWQLALLSALIVPVFTLADGYYAWLCSQAIEHAKRLEAISVQHFNILGRDANNDEKLLEFRATLQSHKFGLYSNLKRFRVTAVWGAFSALSVFRLVYGTLVLVSSVASIAFGVLTALGY